MEILVENREELLTDGYVALENRAFLCLGKHSSGSTED